MKILEKPIVKISKKMDAVTKKMKVECKGKEFLFYILAPKDNPFRWVEAVAPPQEVTGVSVDVKKDGKMSEYEKIFLAYMKNDNLRCVGTFHFHPIEGFSGIDDDDLGNHACFNTTHGLPFIDITMDTEETYFARAVIKVGLKENRQLFQIDCEYEIDEAVDINGFEDKIDKIVSDTKTLFQNGYKINEKKLKEAITPEVDVTEFLQNIKEKVYQDIIWKKVRVCREEKISSDIDLGLSKIKWNMEFHKHRKRFIVDVVNDVDNDLQDDLERFVATNDVGKIIEMETLHDANWRATIYCGSKKEGKRLRKELYELFASAKDEIEDYLGAFMYTGRYSPDTNEAGKTIEEGIRDSLTLYDIGY